MEKVPIPIELMSLKRIKDPRNEYVLQTPPGVLRIPTPLQKQRLQILYNPRLELKLQYPQCNFLRFVISSIE